MSRLRIWFLSWNLRFMGGEFWECAAALQGHNPAGVMAGAPVEIDITGRRDLLCLLRSAPTEPN